MTTVLTWVAWYTLVGALLALLPCAEMDADGKAARLRDVLALVLVWPFLFAFGAMAWSAWALIRACAWMLRALSRRPA